MIRTRIAPSPTGNDIHIGNLYTALINWAYARKNKGKFIIRIEDTDRERYVKGAEEKILSTLKAYGLDYDEGIDVSGPYAPYRQSERLDIYQKYAKELVEKGVAYYCFCTQERLKELKEQQVKEGKATKYDRFCLDNVKNAEERIKKGDKYVIRLKVPDNTAISFNDLIRGEIKFQSETLDDQVLIKSDGFPTYHMAVVVDDHLMEVSHIIRAEEWISSTPKHVLLYDFLGWALPIFVHLPILRNPDKSKLSKRKNPVWASWYLEQGFIPEAVLNYLALMGWSHPEGKEIFDLHEFIEKLKLEEIGAVGPAFDIIKLEWMNGVYIRNFSNEELLKYLLGFDESLKDYDKSLLEKFVELAKTRMKTLKDFKDQVEPFLEKPKVELSEKELNEREELRQVLENIEEWTKDNISEVLKSFISKKEVKFPYLYQIIIRRNQGLPIVDTFEIIGKEATLKLLS